MNDERPLLALSMILKDEEANLREMLPPLLPHFDEVCCAVDDRTTDGTLAYLEEIGAKVVLWAWNDSFADARNAALDLVTARYVMTADGDNRMDPEGLTALREQILKQKADDTAYLICFIEPNAIMYMKLVCWPNRPSIRYERRIHEEVTRSCVEAGLEFVMSNIVIQHRPLTVEDNKSRFERNLRYLEPQRKEMPDDASTLYHLGVCYAGLKRNEDALEALEALLKLPPTEITLHTLILAMRVRALTGNNMGAALALERARALAPKHPVVRLMCAEQYAAEQNAYGVLAQLDGVVFEPGIVPYPVEACQKRAEHLLAVARKKLGMPEPTSSSASVAAPLIVRP